jgi:hypothetical protein
MPIKPSTNFLNWYKFCCQEDCTIYRKIIFSQRKAKVYYSLIYKNDYALYPLNGTQKLLSGTQKFCEEHIESEMNTKFLIFSLKKDIQVEYLIKNNKVSVI